MIPKTIDKFENGAVTLEVHEINNEEVYWLQLGAAALYMDWESVCETHELLNALIEEEKKPISKPILRIVSLVVLIVVVAMIIGAVAL